MYLPSVFAVKDLPVLQDFMEQYSFATLVTRHSDELIASHIPFVLDRAAGPHGTLRGHLAVRNPQLAHLESGSEALVIFQGPHLYISPSWYATPHNVPTWNYTAVHAYGIPKIVDRAALVVLLKDLVRQNERSLEPPWDFDPEASWVQAMLPEIGAFEIPIENLQGKFKLNQNRVPADRARVIEILSASEDPVRRQMADLIIQASGYPATLPSNPPGASTLFP
jgi:transcriptional regulator